ncbi:MAG: hypothetical protein RL660_359 [Bacteroidota bacterium]|jgi:endonuclease YncB( thermonuclease family)
MNLAKLFITVALCAMPYLANSIAACINTIDGKVIGIVDGDTIDVLQNKVTYRIRLADIDAPEKGQPYGNVAKKVMSALVFGKQVQVQWQSQDRNKRYLGTVFCAGTDVCLAMIQKGYAWKYYAANNAAYASAMAKAKSARLGLWAAPKPIDPHDWRRLSKAERDRYR